MSISSLYSSTLRMNGLVSGMDTDALVSNLVKAQQLKVDQVAKKQTLAQWKKDAYLDVNNSIRKFKDSYLTVLADKFNMLGKSTYNTFQVTGLDSDAISVSASSASVTGKYAVKVEKIADAAKLKDIDARLTDAGMRLAGGKRALTQDEIDAGKIVLNDGSEIMLSAEDIASGKITLTDDDKTAIQAEIDSLTAERINNKSLIFVNGKKYVGDTNEVKVDGLTITAKKITMPGSDVVDQDTNIQGNGVLEFKIGKDVKPAVDAIKSFVTEYNKLVDSLTALYTDKKDKDYPVLGAEKRAEMSDADLEEYNTNAKKGILNRDMYIDSLLRDISKAFTSKIEGLGRDTDIGVMLGSQKSYSTYSTKTNYKLEIDETALTKALNEDPDKVMGIFTNVAYDPNIKVSTGRVGADGKVIMRDTTEFEQKGLMPRLMNMLDKTVDSIRDGALKNADENLKIYGKAVTSAEDRMKAQLEKYYIQFAKMESLMSKFQSQSDWFSAQMGSGK